MDSKEVKQVGDPLLLRASAEESQELDGPEHISSLSNQQPEPASEQLAPFSASHLVLKQNTKSINSFNALKFTTCKRTDAKNEEGYKLCSCCVKMEIPDQVFPLLSAGMMPQPGTIPGFSIPSPCPAHGHKAMGEGHPCTTEMGTHELFPGRIKG